MSWFDDIMSMLATREQSKKDGICNMCKEPILSFRDEESEREYQISALCQSCQDSVFEPDPYHEEGDEDDV